MNNLLVSVIIATYRREESLEKAIESVCSQTYRDVEIVIVDDNDDVQWNHKVEAIVEKGALNSPFKIVYLQNHPNKGSAISRNLGIDASSGDYITFLDDDDYYLPDKVETQIDDIVSNKADYSLTDLDLYYDDGSLCERKRRLYLTNQTNLLICHLKYHLTGTDTMMFRKSYIKQIGGFEPIDVGDEYYLMMKAIQGGGVFSYLPKSSVIAFVHFGEGGLSSGDKKIKGENDLFKYKKTFFSCINSKDKKYIVMRHYAVLSFAYLRKRKYILFISNALLSFLSDPFQCLSLLLGRKKSGQ